MTREIALTQGLVALVDDDDYEAAVSAGKWCVSVKETGRAYALRGVRKDDGTETTIRLHNFLTGWQFVDHINGDGLDNRRANLRPAAHRTNGANRGRTALNTSGYKGVTWHKGAGKWAAQIVAAGRSHYLGLFHDPVEAARAYDAAAHDLHGQFARPNFPATELVA